MRRWCLVLLVIALWGIVAPGEAAERWQALRVPEAGFAIMVPDAPKISAPASQIGERTRDYICEIGQTAYLVSYTIYPAERVRGLDAGKLLDAVRDAAVRDVAGTLRSERRFTLSSAQARELVIDGGDSLVYKARLYVRGARVYRTVVNGPPGFEASADANRFLDSFQIMPQ